MADSRVYECMFIFDPNKYARNPGEVSGRIPEMIESLGGEILANRLWVEQKLAYPIDGHKKGAYWLTYCRLGTDQLVKFNRACQLNDDIIRHLCLTVEPRLVDTLVAHARGETIDVEEDAVEEETVAATE